MQKQRIKLARVPGVAERTVMVEVIGAFGIHRYCRDEWRITHIATGLLAGKSATKDGAEHYAKDLMKIRYAWHELTDPRALPEHVLRKYRTVIKKHREQFCVN